MAEQNVHIESKQREWILPAILLFCLLLLLGPLFLAMPLTNDAVVYDLHSRWLTQGIVPYRDIIEPNLPGVLVIHSVTRFLLGEGSESLRFVDLLLILTTAIVAMKLISLTTHQLKTAMWACLTVLLFYLSQSEWCHCQRDTWLLLPALTAAYLRINQSQKLYSGRRLFLHSLLEGLVWGSGVWLKPHLLIVCGMVWAVSLLMTATWKSALIDSAGLLAGGLIAGAVGVGWLISVGAWKPFLVSLREWNPGYLAARKENWTIPRYIAMNIRFFPWTLLHLVAIPVGIWQIIQFIRQPDRRNNENFTGVVLFIVYFFWLKQAHLLQHLFDYVHVPGVVLAIIVLAASSKEFPLLRSKPLIALLFGTALATGAAFSAQRLSLWRSSASRNLTSAQVDTLTHFENPVWEDLKAVEQYLRDQQVTGQQVLLYNSDLISLYWNLQLQSPTPYLYVSELQSYFPDRKSEIQKSMHNCGARFVVVDLVSCGMRPQRAEEIGPEGKLAPPPGYTRIRPDYFPFTERVIFRAGRYLVLEVNKAIPTS